MKMIKRLALIALLLHGSVSTWCGEGPPSHILQRTIIPQDSIIWAASKRDFNSVQRWIDYEPNSIWYKDKKGDTALTWASSTGDEKIVTLLLNTADAQHKTKELLLHKNNTGKNALSWAAYKDQADIVRMLLQAGRSVRTAKEMLLQSDTHGELATDWAAGQGRIKSLKVLLDEAEYFNIIPEILAHKNKTKTNLLMHGIMAGSPAVVELVLLTAYTHLDTKQFDTFINEKGYKGRTALHCVPRFTQGGVKYERELHSQDTMATILKEIFKYPGVMIMKKDDSRHTPIYWAAYYDQPKLLEAFEQYVKNKPHELMLFDQERLKGLHDRNIDLNIDSKKRSAELSSNAVKRQKL